MIRFIIKRRWRSDADSGANGENYETHDIDVPELEKLLFERGGMSQYGFEAFDLAGVERIQPANK